MWEGDGEKRCERDRERVEILILNNKPFMDICMPLLLQAGLLSSCHWIGHSKVRKSADYCFAVTLFSSVQFSRSVVSDSLRPHESQHASLSELPEFTQTHVHQVSGAIQPSDPTSSPSPPAPNPFHYQSLFQWVNSSHQVAKVLEFQLQHHPLQRNPRADLGWTDH